MIRKTKSQSSSLHLQSLAVLIFLVVDPIAAYSNSEESASSAIDVLSAFSGARAQHYEQYFEYSTQSRIVRVEMHSVGMENTIARYTSQEIPWHEVNNILRITTADGFEGISGVDTYYQGGFSNEHLRELERVVASLPAIASLDPTEVSLRLRKKHPDVSDTVLASIDIALWDLAAKKAGKPLSQFLGANRISMPAYASLPFYASLPEYIEAVNQYAELGFSHFKFHVWGSIEEDLRLVELVQQTFAHTDYRFMVDLESLYNVEEATRLGKQMEAGLFFWFEAPINDAYLEQYAELRNDLSLQIIPAGYNIYSPEYIKHGIEKGAWDAGRFDATVVGGISAALERLIIANEADLTIDVQSWGHTLAQAANLHVMLANDRTEFFEAPMPKEVFEFGMKNSNLLNNGKAIAPSGPGLGVSVMWERLPAADFHSSSSFEFPSVQHASGIQ